MHEKHRSPIAKILLVLLPFSTACVDPYLKQFTGTETIIIVEGRLTNDPSVNFVQLTEAVPSDGTTIYFSSENAIVKVIVNENQTVDLTESFPGFYAFPENFKGETGNTYKLVFSTADGRQFESRTEEMTSGQEIKTVYSEYAPDVISSPDGFSSGQRIYIDTDDDAATKDFYMWDWKLYEETHFCQTCFSSFYYRDNTTDFDGECKVHEWAFGIYDYGCDFDCWDIIHSQKVNIMNDDFSNGKEIKARLVAEIPIYQFEGSLIEINQYKITEAAYDYLKLIVRQGQETGGLADTPPATLTGNISSPNNADQPVTGYFLVSSVSQVRHWLDKSEVPIGARPIGLLGGRRPKFEPDLGDDRPPYAPCTESRLRTGFMPEGWVLTPYQIKNLQIH